MGRPKNSGPDSEKKKWKKRVPAGTAPGVKRTKGRHIKHALDLAETRGMFPVRPKSDRHIPSEDELYTNLQTYCEELLWIRNKAGVIVPFVWNKQQIRLYNEVQKAREQGYRNILILKYRRLGVTTLFQAENFFTTANNEHKSAVTLAHDTQSTQKIFNISILYYNKLPDWARPERKTENKKELNFHRLGSEFYVGTAGGRSFGRGQTVQKVHGSEVAFWPKSQDTSVLIAGLMEAASHGDLTLETTANGVGNWFHKTWTMAKNKENNFYPIFLSWHNDEELVIQTRKTFEDLRLDSEEEALVKAYDLSPSQVLWRRIKKRDLFDPDRGDLLFKQEYPINDIEAFISSGSCFFDAEIMAKLIPLCSPVESTADSGRLKVYHQPKQHGTYVVAADIGEGVAGGNRTSITVIDTVDCEEMACWVGICSPEEAARKMASLGELYNMAMLAPEANNFGHSTINTLLNEINYSNIFQHTDYQKITVDGFDVQPKFGWQTNARTRPIMLSEFRYALHNGLYKVNDPELFAECMAFVDNGHGKYEAAEGSYDDRVFSHAIAWQARNKQLETTDWSQYAVDTGIRSIAMLLD